MAAVQALVGFLTLILGRQYYAVYVGAMAFMLAYLLIPEYFPRQPASSLLMISILVGGVIGGLSFTFKRSLAFAASAFVGGSLGFYIIDILRLNPTFQNLTVFLIAGALAALLTLFFFDFAIIFFSALYGSSLILQSIHLPGFSTLVWFILFSVFGIVVQWVLLQYGHPEPD